MTRFIHVLLALLCACGLGLSAGARAQAQTQTQTADASGYAFSPVNQFGIQLTASYWNPILEWVSRRSGVSLSLKVGRTSADTTSYVLAQEVDFAFTNHLFSEERRKMGWKVLARRDYAPVHGELVVLADSPIKNPEDLRGEDVAFSGPEAFVIYKVPYAYLLSKGIDIKVVFAGNQDGAIGQLLSGKVKAIGANSQLIDGYVAREKIAVRKIWTSPPYNDLVLMASPRVPAKDVKAVRDAFLAMGDDPAGAAILKQVTEMVKFPPFTRFIPTTEDDYKSYIDFYRTAPPNLQ